MTDQELRTLIKKSKKEGHRAVFDQYSNYVYTIVYSKLHGCASREDIEECVSDVFAQCFRHCDTDMEGSLQGYIGIIAKRTAINAFYRLSRKSFPSFSLDDENTPEFQSSENIEQDYEAKAMRKYLLQKIEELSEPDSSIIIQKFYYQRNASQIGKMLSLNPVTVRKRCQRAVKRLKTILSKEEFYEKKAESRGNISSSGEC